MAKWKCEICGSNFENFHAQGFNNKIYCPLCYFKKENQELKKQLEEKEKLIEQCDLSVSNMMNCYCERTDCSGRIKDSKVYDSLVQKVENQQQEFIKWLEKKQSFLRDEISELTLGMCNTDFQDIKIEIYQEVLQKYKEIIGEKENENND